MYMMVVYVCVCMCGGILNRNEAEYKVSFQDRKITQE